MLNVHTLNLERNPLPFLRFVESSLGSVEGNGVKIYFLSFERSKLDRKYSLIVSVCMHALLQRNVVLDIVYYFGDWMSVYVYACMGGLDQF